MINSIGVWVIVAWNIIFFVNISSNRAKPSRKGLELEEGGRGGGGGGGAIDFPMHRRGTAERSRKERPDSLQSARN